MKFQRSVPSGMSVSLPVIRKSLERCVREKWHTDAVEVTMYDENVFDLKVDGQPVFGLLLTIHPDIWKQGAFTVSESSVLFAFRGGAEYLVLMRSDGRAASFISLEPVDMDYDEEEDGYPNFSKFCESVSRNEMGELCFTFTLPTEETHGKPRRVVWNGFFNKSLPFGHGKKKKILRH